MTAEMAFARKASGLVRGLSFLDAFGVGFMNQGLTPRTRVMGPIAALCYFADHVELYLRRKAWARVCSQGSTMAATEDSRTACPHQKMESATIRVQADLLVKYIEEAPKSTNWKNRAKIGTRKPWYQDVTDWT